MTVLKNLGKGALRWLKERFEEGRLIFPPHHATLKHQFKDENLALASYFAELAHEGMNERGVIRLLQAVLDERQEPVRRYWPVLSGLGEGFGARLSQVVLDESFNMAEERVWLSSYNLGGRAHQNVLKGLVTRLAEVPSLDVRLFLDIKLLLKRDAYQDGSQAAILEAIGRDFRQNWPGAMKPRFFYDKRGIEERDSCLHAKTTIIDRKRILITSANLSRQGQEQNLEAGLLVEDFHLCDAFAHLFQELIEEKALIEL